MIIEEFPGLWTALMAASLVDILLEVLHSAWSAGIHLVSSSPSAVQISWIGSVDLFTPELRMSQNSWLHYS